MAGEISKRKRIYTFALESSYNVDKIDADLAASADLDVFDLGSGTNFTVQSARIELDRVRNSTSPSLGENVKTGTAVKIMGDFKGWRGGTAGNETAFWGVILRACGHSETIVAATSAEYKPRTSVVDSLTGYEWLRVLGASDIEHRVAAATGLRGVIDMIEIASKSPWKFEATLQSPSYLARTAANTFWNASGVPIKRRAGTPITYLGVVDQDDGETFKGQSVTLTIDGQTFGCKFVRLRPGQEIAQKESIAGEVSGGEVFVVGARPTIEFEIDGDETEYDKLLALLASRSSVAGTIVGTSVGGDCKCTISFPAGQILDEPGEVDNAGIAGFSAVLQLAGDYSSSVIGDNAYSIKIEAP